MKVHSFLGMGFSEIVYKDALVHELTQNGIPFKREKKYQVNYRGTILPHEYYADFVVFDKVIVEVKSVSQLKDEHIEQTINYLAVSGLEVALLINFRSNKLEYRRLILTHDKR